MKLTHRMNAVNEVGCSDGFAAGNIDNGTDPEMTGRLDGKLTMWEAIRRLSRVGDGSRPPLPWLTVLVSVCHNRLQGWESLSFIVPRVGDANHWAKGRNAFSVSDRNIAIAGELVIRSKNLNLLSIGS